MKKYIIYFLIIVVLSFFISSFIEKDVSQKVYNTDNSIVISVNNIPKNLRKVDGLKEEDKNLICATSIGLVKLNSQGEVEPALAKKYEISKDGIEYNFILDSNKCWTDGKKINGQDVVNFLCELIKYEDSNNIEAILGIYGAKEFKDGIVDFNKGVAITAEDNNIKIRLNKKNDNFLRDLTRVQYRLRKNLNLWENIEDNYSRIKYSGDYFIKKVEEKEIKLESNDYLKNIKSIIMVKDSNIESAMASYEVGDRDVIINPPFSELSRLSRENKNVVCKENKGIYIFMNISSLNLRKQILDNIYEAQDEYLNNNSNAFESSEGSYFRKDKENLEKLQSRKVSINLNVVNERIPWKIDILAEDLEEVDSYCRVIKEWFSKNKTVDINYTLVSKKDLEDEKLRKQYDIVLIEFTEEDKNRDELYKQVQKFRGSEEQNLTGWSNTFEEGLFNLCEVVPGIFINKNMALSDKVKSIKFDGNGNIDFYNIK